MEFSSFGYCKSDNSVPIAHLDYQFVGSCNDEKYLEKIVKILRSGEEGHYPDLVKAAEERLTVLNPESKTLLKTSPALTSKELASEDRNNVLRDIENWRNTISQLDKTLLSNANQPSESHEDIPPIRQTGQVADVSKEQQTIETKTRNPTPRNFKDWEKFDVKEELEKVNKQVNPQGDHSPLTKETPIQDQTTVENGLPKSELMTRAVYEKGKGNEAFKESNYSEALAYYNRSLSLFPLIEVFNNRAITYIKLGEYNKAIHDCDKVLKLEPSNLKAYLRRGCAYQSLQHWREAEMDFQSVLQIEPGNKRAKTLLEEIKEGIKNEKLSPLSPSESIDSLKADQSNTANIPSSEKASTEKNGQVPSPDSSNVSRQNEETTKTHDSTKRSKGTRLKIIEVESTEKEKSSGGLNVLGEKEDFNVEGSKEDDENEAKSHTTTVNNAETTRKRGKKINIVEVEDESEIEGLKERSSLTTTTTPDATEKDDAALKPDGKTTEGLPNEDLPLLSPQAGESVVAAASITPSTEPSKNIEAISHTTVPDGVLKLKDEGNGFFKAGNYSSALEKYSTALDVLSKDLQPHLDSRAILLSNRAVCRLKVGDCKGCVEDATQSISCKPSAKAYLRRATAQDTLERYEEAYVDYQTAVKLDPNSKAGWDALTRLVPLLRDKHGLVWREKLPSAPPTLPPVLPKSANATGMTEPRPQQDTTKVAAPPKMIELEETVEEKFKRAKENGNRFVQQGKYQEAANCYTECMTLLPKEVVSYTNRALCFLKTNEAQKAEEDCGKALELQPTNVKALFRRAQARKALKKLRESIADLMSLLKIEPENAAAKKELDVVKEAWRQELRNLQSQQQPKVGSKSKGTTTSTQKKSDIKETTSSPAKDSHTSIGSDGIRKRKNKSTKEHSSTAGQVPHPQENGKTTIGKDNTVPVASPLTVHSEDLKLMKVTPFEFWRAWNCVKQKEDTASYAKILRQVQPSQMSKVISNKIDADVIPIMVSTVRNHFLVDDLVFTGFRFLEELSKVHRFKMALMFLSAEDTAMVRRTISELEKKCLENKKLSLSTSALANLKRSYGVS